MRLLSLAAALVVGLSIADIGWAAGEDIAKYKADLASSDKEKRREAAYQLKGAGAEAKEALPALIEALRDEDKQVWSDAVAALANLGPEAAAAIPTLIEHLGGTRTGARRERDQLQTVVRSAHALSKIGAAAVPKLIPALEDESANRRAGAAKSLGGMGPVAREAVPALVERLADPDEPVRLEAAEALGLIGKAAVPALTGAVNSDDAQVRAGAAAALSGVGVDAAPAGPALLSRLETETVPVVRAAFLSALPRIGADGDATVAALLNGLDHSDESVRHAAVNALVTARTLSAKVIARVTERLNSEDVAKRESAARVLGRMGRNAADAVPALLAQARKEPANVHFPSALAEIGQPALGPLLEELQREGAAQPWVFTALRNMGSPAMGALTKQLAADSPAVRAGAARALSGMPLDGHPVLKTLNELAADPQPEVRAAVLRTLATVRTERAAVMPRLEAALQDPAGPVRTAAASGLAEMGAVAKLDAKALLELLDEMDITTQRAAIQALGALGPKAEPAVATLTAKLESPELQRAALEALGKIGPAAAPAVPQITTLAKSPNEELSLNALQALNSIGQDLAPVLPLLYEALKHQNRDLRIIAVQALPKAEKDEAKVLAALIEALDDQSGRIRRVAAEALVPYGEKGRAAIPVLLKLLDRDMERPAILTALRAMKVRDVPALLGVLEHKDPATRIYACNALGELGRDAESAVPQLEKRASGDSDPVRKAAQEALKRIQQPS